MSNELINALETRVTSAVDTIEGLRTEVKTLREDRQILEDKLRELLLKIETADANGSEAPVADAMPSSNENSQQESSNEEPYSGFSPARNNAGGGFSQPDY